MLIAGRYIILPTAQLLEMMTKLDDNHYFHVYAYVQVNVHLWEEEKNSTNWHTAQKGFLSGAN